MRGDILLLIYPKQGWSKVKRVSLMVKISYSSRVMKYSMMISVLLLWESAYIFFYIIQQRG